MTKPARCQCRICKLLRAIEPLRKRASKAQLKALETIFLEWEGAATEAAYLKASLNGTWPQ